MIEVNKTYDLVHGIDQQAYRDCGKRALATATFLLTEA